MKERPDDLESQKSDRTDNTENKTDYSRSIMDILVAFILFSLLGFLIYVGSNRDLMNSKTPVPVDTLDMGGSGVLDNSNINTNNNNNLNVLNMEQSTPIHIPPPTDITEKIFVLLRYNSKKHELFSFDFDDKHWSKNSLEKAFNSTVLSNFISYSKDGEKIVFQDSDRKLRVFNRESKSLESVDLDEVALSPTINSDGNKILFKSTLKPNNLKTIEFDEESKRWGKVKVVQEVEKGELFSPVISPKGDSFVYLVKSPEHKLYSLHRKKLNNSASSLKFEFPLNNVIFGNRVLVSPDGNKCAFIVKTVKKMNVTPECMIIMDMKKKEETKTFFKIEPEISYELLSWSNDGKSIYFSSHQYGKSDLFYEYKLEDKSVSPLKDENGDQINL